MREFDVDGRLHGYDCGGDGFVVMWHGGTPNIGTPPAPLYGLADELGIRFVGYDRPGYGGSAARPGRSVGDAAEDAAAVADALGVGRFAVMGASGGGPHSLACAALLGDRVTAAVSISGLRPYDGSDAWFDGMGPTGVAGLRAAIEGRAAKEEFEQVEHDPDFIAADWEAFKGEWGWLGSVVVPALANGPGAAIDDDLAYVNPWGFDPAAITVPVFFLHGEADRVVPAAHSGWLADRIKGSEIRIQPGAGHISVLTESPSALDWLSRHR